MAFDPIVAEEAKVTWTPTGTGGTEVTLKNTKWSLQKKRVIKEAHNNSDGTFRVAGTRLDAEGKVEGYWDRDNPITAQIDTGSDGTLKLYVDATLFYSLSAIIGDDLEVSFDLDDLGKYSFSYMMKAGTITDPIIA